MGETALDTSTIENNYGASDRFVHIQCVQEPGKTKTSDVLEEGPSKVRDLWHVNIVTA